MNKTMFISHGDKGGVGKSITAAIMIERLLMEGVGRLALIEGDSNNKDVGDRYQDVAEVRAVNLPLNRPGAEAANAVTTLASWVETEDPDALVINLPSNAGETLDGLSQILRGVCDGLGIRMVATYSLGMTDALTAGMVKSLRTGLLSHVDPENRAAVYPLFSGPKESFLWARSNDRARYPMQEIEMPRFGAVSSMGKMLNTPGRIVELGERGAPGWLIVDRINVAEWVHAAMRAMDPILQENDHEER
ncbi:hypothetical protein HF563_02070 [Acidithiobacillus ferridurans]|nr:hypothetical protein [Acidithiobacillus ferridurans]